MISFEDAFRLLNKWKDEKSTMRFLLAFSFGGGSFSGRVADVTRTTVQLIGADLQSEFRLSLASARFEYGDAREAPEELRDRSDKYVGCLTALVPSGDRISFFELRSGEASAIT